LENSLREITEMIDLSHIHPMLVHFPLVFFITAAVIFLVLAGRRGNLAARECLPLAGAAGHGPAGRTKALQPLPLFLYSLQAHELVLIFCQQFPGKIC
jgi:hypothetical protein